MAETEEEVSEAVVAVEIVEVEEAEDLEEEVAVVAVEAFREVHPRELYVLPHIPALSKMTLCAVQSPKRRCHC